MHTVASTHADVVIELSLHLLKCHLEVHGLLGPFYFVILIKFKSRSNICMYGSHALVRFGLHLLIHFWNYGFDVYVEF